MAVRIRKLFCGRLLRRSTSAFCPKATIVPANMSVIRSENIGLLSMDSNNNPVLLNPKKVSRQPIVDNRESNQYPINEPLYIDLYPSFICNQNCVFCYNVFLKNNDKTVMTKEIADKVIDFCQRKGVFWINIVGGEPYHPKNVEITKYIVEKAFEKGIKSDITTNLSFVNNEIVSFCKAHDVRFNVSLLAKDEEIGKKMAGAAKYDAISKIDKHVNGKISFGISTPILKINKKDIFNLCDYVSGLENCAWVLRYPTVPDEYGINLSIDEFYSISKELIEKCNKKVYFDAPFCYKYMDSKLPQNELDYLYGGCKAGLIKREILPNGDVVSCILLKEKVLGNIEKDNDFEAVSYRNPSCKNFSCQFNNFCTGCPGYLKLNNKKGDDRCAYYEA